MFFIAVAVSVEVPLLEEAVTGPLLEAVILDFAVV